MKRIRVFLSHASSDKKFVNRMKRDVQSAGYTTWIDEDDIDPGQSISEEIQRGLKLSQVVLLFLSERSIASKWVSAEWQSSFFRQISTSNVQVVPIRLDDCELPEFLIDRKYIDFREAGSYERSLAEVLSFLSKLREDYADDPVKPHVSGDGVLSHVQEILDDLSGEKISLPQIKKIEIIGTLKKIPRSGKTVRLSGFSPAVNTRSVYDHVLSLAHLFDCLLPFLGNSLSGSDTRDLSLLIAYHEISEVILGDIPSYTSLTPKKRKSISIFAEQRLRSVAPSERELIANRFVWMFLTEKHREAFSAVMDMIADRDNEPYKTFRSIDKMDPIVAVWRYLHHYRGKLGKSPREFNSRMKDFYENPDVGDFLKRAGVDPAILDLLAFLQNRQSSWDYYEQGAKFIEESRDLVSLPPATIINAIEGIELFRK